MIDGKRIIAVIPARGGSKGVARKNIRQICGRPLIAWTIDAARGSALIDDVILSSEDAEIIETARQHGCRIPFVRDASLATDEATSVDVVLDAIARVPGNDWIVLLQPTSPLRSSADIDALLRHCEKLGAPAGVSVVATEESPYWMYTINGDSTVEPVVPRNHRPSRRQDLPPTYMPNGAIYAARCDWLQIHRTFMTSETVAFVMPPERSLDIDDESDLLTFESAMRSRP